MRKQTYILGPCAAESREQVMATAKAITDRFADRLIYRAGVWKPRTSPSTFQGAGEQALEWLAEVKATYGIPVATEVATPEQGSIIYGSERGHLLILLLCKGSQIGYGLPVTGYGDCLSRTR